MGLAGGVDPELSNDGRVVVVDADGRMKKGGQLVEPGDRILVRKDDFFYNFNRYFPIISSGIALILTTITVVNLLTP